MKISKDRIVEIAIEMYEEGAYYSERYSVLQCKKRGWEGIDNKNIYEALDSYIRFLRKVDNYEREE